MSDLDGIQNCRQFLILHLPVKISLCFPYSSVGCFSSSLSVSKVWLIHTWIWNSLSKICTHSSRETLKASSPADCQLPMLQFKNIHLSFSLPSVQCFQIHPLQDFGTPRKKIQNYSAAKALSFRKVEPRVLYFRTSVQQSRFFWVSSSSNSQASSKIYI